MKKTKLASYFLILFLSALTLFIGNRIAVTGFAGLGSGDGAVSAEGRVTAVLSVSLEEAVFEAEIAGEGGRRTVAAVQNISENYLSGAKTAETGDRVILSESPEGGAWVFVDYVRIRGVMVLGAVFLALLLWFGRVKGLNAILTLGLTCVAVFAIFLPAFLSGKNIYGAAVFVCVYSILSTLFIVYGIDRKSIAAVIGCFGGIIFIGALTFLMNAALRLTGTIREDAMYLLALPDGSPIDIRAVVFASITIGAVGAVMDVAVTMSSSLWELKSQAPGMGFGALAKSGMNIGRDVMGTMINTLVLAYIGSSLSTLLLLAVYINSFTELINSESVIMEVLQSVIGSFGLLLTMPLTAAIAAALFTGFRGAAPANVEAAEA